MKPFGELKIIGKVPCAPRQQEATRKMDVDTVVVDGVSFPCKAHLHVHEGYPVELIVTIGDSSGNSAKLPISDKVRIATAAAIPGAGIFACLALTAL